MKVEFSITPKNIFIITIVLATLYLHLGSSSDLILGVRELLLAVISSLCLSLVAAILIDELKNKVVTEMDAKRKKSEINQLVNELRLSLERSEHRLNFRNDGPNFYFDVGRVNQLADILSNNSCYWINLLKTLDGNDTDSGLATACRSFYSIYSKALISAEKTDTLLMQSLMEPEAAAMIEVCNQANLEEKQTSCMTKLRVFRGFIAGADSTSIFFGFALWTKSPISLKILDDIQEELKTLLESNLNLRGELKSLQECQKVLKIKSDEVYRLVND